MPTPSRGEVYWVRLDPSEGHEQQKTRPCVVLTGDIHHQYMRMAVVVPLTSKLGLRNPGCPVILEGEHILSLPGKALENGRNLALCHQIRAVDIDERFLDKHGDMTRAGMAEIENSVAWVLNLMP
jgi:mRNA interferase MazF